MENIELKSIQILDKMVHLIFLVDMKDLHHAAQYQTIQRYVYQVAMIPEL
jgi:hypothetical protein